MSKQSPNLAKFVNNPRNKHYTKVYLQKRDDKGNHVTEWNPNLMYIGHADDVSLCGARLIRVLCGDFQTWSFPFSPDSVTDITDEFWKEYEADGRCAIDRSHKMYFQNADDRFTQVGNTRRCNWCGQWHVSEVKKLVRIERVKHWNLGAKHNG